MKYKVVIDAGHGGSDFGYQDNGIVEKDYALLISNYMKDRLDDLGIESIVTRNTDRTLSDDDRISIITSAFGNNDDVIVVSNHLNKGYDSGIEIVYALRNDDTFSSEIAKQLMTSGGIVNKYYQLRDPINTMYDSISIIRDTPYYETVMIEYGYVNDSLDADKIKDKYLDYAEAVIRAITVYTGNEYKPLESSNYYVVKKGDTLWRIAINYGVSVEDIKSFNNLSSNNLDIGQVLYIPILDKEEIYIVKSGDSLWKIANIYGVSVDSIKKLNNLTSNLISIGQKLKIPNFSYNEKVYIVKSGDSLWKIANIYGVSVDSIKKLNNLTSNLISIGQKLKIPID